MLKNEKISISISVSVSEFSVFLALGLGSRSFLPSLQHYGERFEKYAIAPV